MKYFQHPLRTIAMWAVAATFISSAALQAQTPIADYQLQGNYNNSAAGTVGILSAIGTGNTFVTATVNGQSQQVLNVPSGSGVTTPASPFAAANQGTYSIVLLSFINTSTSVTTKVFDFKNFTTDAGLYINGATGFLQFIDNTSTVIVGGTGLVPVVSGTYFQLTLTRTAAGVVTGYQGGTQSFQFTDSGNLATLGTMLSIFKDDNIGTNVEDSAGAIARLRLYNDVLTPAQVAALAAVPEPSVWVMLLGGGLLLGVAARRFGHSRA